MISNLLISDEKKNKLKITNVYMGQNEFHPSLESYHGT